jgi:hypothetical protein
MREVQVERFVPATPPVVAEALTPERVVEYEGSFEVLDTRQDDAATLVTAGARGLQLVLRFEPDGEGWRYEQEGRAGPFDRMWTRLGLRAENEGTRLTATSGVSLGLPLPALTDRVAGWKRRGELERLLDQVAADLG